MAVAYRVDTLHVTPFAPGHQLTRLRGIGVVQKHQVAPLHRVAWFVRQLVLQCAHLARAQGMGDKNHLIGLTERAAQPGRRSAVGLVDQIVKLLFEFVVAIPTRPARRGVRVERALHLGRHVVGAPDLREGTAQAGGHLARTGPRPYRHHHEDLRMPPFHHLARMAQMVVDGLREHLVQRQRMH